MFNHCENITPNDISAKKSQMKHVALNPKYGFGKGLSLPLKKQVHAAKVAIAHLVRDLIRSGHSLGSEQVQKQIAIKACSFNTIRTQKGQTSLVPIGLMALCRLKMTILKKVIHQVKECVLNDSYSQLQQEFIKHKPLLDPTNAQKAATDPFQSPPMVLFPQDHIAQMPLSLHPQVDPMAKPVVMTPVYPSAILVADDIPPAVKKDEITAAPTTLTTENTIEAFPQVLVEGLKDSVSQEAQKVTASVIATPEKISVPDTEAQPIEKKSAVSEEKKVEEIKIDIIKLDEESKAEKPKSKKSKKGAAHKLSFWQKIMNLFKSIIDAIVRFFTGKKKDDTN
jgi:hypothetical protein